MKKSYAEQYAAIEKTHWWFRARRGILRDRIKALRWPEHSRVLEIGVGSGENLYTLYPDGTDLVGVEPDEGLARTARAKGDVAVHVATAEELPAALADHSFDVITMFDLLEHTKDDVLVLRRARQKLKPDGILVMSVPAFMFLWGQQDAVNLHYRRYTRKGLVARLRQAGFIVERATYFNSFLFLPIAVFRVLHKLQRCPDGEAQTDFRYSLGWGDKVMYHVFLSEKWFLRFISFPFGTSVFVAARNANGTE